MKILLDRQGAGKFKTDTVTIGKLHVDNLCVYSLEDDFDEKKKYGHTRIPAGTYRLKLRTYGSHHERYLKKFPGDHIGMIEICDVPNYTDVLLHIGNSDRDTKGCLLIGMSQSSSLTIGQSTVAYRLIYPKIALELMKGKEVYIKIID